jgi:type IX secretion system substrate protein
MKKELLILGMLFVSATLCFSQRTLIDFEPGGETAQFTVFGADSWTVEPMFQIIENPDASGINASDSVGLYIEPNEGEPWMGMFYKPADVGQSNIDFSTGFTELCMDVWMEAAGTVVLKAEVNSTGEQHEGAPINVSTTGSWVEVCQDFAGTPVDGKMVETVVIFFNIGSVPANVTNHYFDNIVQTGISTSVSNIEASAFEVYPNPVNDVLFYNTDFQVDQVIISDMVGKELSRSYATEQGEVSVAGLPLGVYIISFTDQKGRMGSTKFVKL